VSQVVHGYGDVCQAITELAVELDAPISSDDFRMLNRCLDDAIAAAVTEFGSERDQSIEGEAADETQRLGVLAHQLRTSIHSARGALDAIKSGRVGIAGSTGSVLDRSLVVADELIERLVALEIVATRRSPVKTRA
jgi:signal transduction histidine kinase